MDAADRNSIIKKLKNTFKIGKQGVSPEELIEFAQWIGKYPFVIGICCGIRLGKLAEIGRKSGGTNKNCG